MSSLLERQNSKAWIGQLDLLGTRDNSRWSETSEGQIHIASNPRLYRFTGSSSSLYLGSVVTTTSGSRRTSHANKCTKRSRSAATATTPFISSCRKKKSSAATSTRNKITQDARTSGKVSDAYASGSFYMGDPEFLESQTGLHFGKVFAYPKLSTDDKLTIRWRAECPWEWPSYESQYRKHGNRRHWCFPLPNAQSVLFGRKYALRIDDGLGGHLVELGLAKPFLVWSEWESE